MVARGHSLSADLTIHSAAAALQKHAARPPPRGATQLGSTTATDAAQQPGHSLVCDDQPHIAANEAAHG
jgi:hypothetical protein